MSLSTMFTLKLFPSAVAIVSDKIAVAVYVPLFFLNPCCLGFVDYLFQGGESVCC